MELTQVKRMASQVLGIGKGRIRIIQPTQALQAMTKDDVRALIKSKAIIKKPLRGMSRVRARVIAKQKKKSRQRGRGSRNSGETMDTLANGLISMKNSEAIGKRGCMIKPASKLLGEVLKIMQGEGYIGGFEFVNDGKAGQYRITLIGRINDCRVIKPRYPVQKTEFVKWEKRYLPSKELGILILSTPKGVMSNKGARAANTGGRLLAFVY